MKQTQSLPPLLTTKQMAKKLKVCEATIKVYRDSGELPFIKIGRRVLFNEQDIQEALKKLKHG